MLLQLNAVLYVYDAHQDSDRKVCLVYNLQIYSFVNKYGGYTMFIRLCDESLAEAWIFMFICDL